MNKYRRIEADINLDNIREKMLLETLLAENKAPWKKWEQEVPIVK